MCLQSANRVLCYTFAVSVFALTPSNIPSFPDRELVTSPGASITTLMMETLFSL